MALPTRARIAGILAIGLFMLSAPGAMASGPYPDAVIGLDNPPGVGDSIHNVDAVNQEVTGVGAVGVVQTFWIRIDNDGFPADSFKVKRSGLFQEGYRVRYYSAAGKDVTGKVNAGSFTTPMLDHGESYLMTATVKVRSLAAACSSVTRKITVSSVNYPGTKDAVRFTEKLDTNCPPVANNDGSNIVENEATVSGNVLLNDSDFDGDTLIVTTTGTVSLNYGSLTINANGSFTYTLDNDLLAVDELDLNDTLPEPGYVYSISDGHGGTDSGVLMITILGVGDSPCVRVAC